MAQPAQSSQHFLGCPTARSQWAPRDSPRAPACSGVAASTAGNGLWTSCGAAWTPAPWRDSRPGCWSRGDPGRGRLPSAPRQCGPHQRLDRQQAWPLAAWPTTSASGRSRPAWCSGGSSWAWWSSWRRHLSSRPPTRSSSPARPWPLPWSPLPARRTLMMPSRGLCIQSPLWISVFSEKPFGSFTVKSKNNISAWEGTFEQSLACFQLNNVDTLCHVLYMEMSLSWDGAAGHVNKVSAGDLYLVYLMAKCKNSVVKPAWQVPVSYLSFVFLWLLHAATYCAFSHWRCDKTARITRQPLICRPINAPFSAL